MCSPGRQRGFTYIGLLVAVVLMGLMLTLVARVWSTTEQREREIQLLYIGHAYRIAISSYFSLGHQYPTTLQDLLTDERFPVPKHHLRRLYADPMTGHADWSLILTPSGQGVMGVASSSQAKPIKLDGFELIDQAFKGADCYCSWQFIYYANRWNRSAGTGGAPTNSPGSPGTFQPGRLETLPSGQPGSLVNPSPGAGSPASDAGPN
jgi:type II secretory pathway pseudopilin PulG